MAEMASNNFILLPNEAEVYVELLEPLTPEEIGSEKWNRQHQYLEKLNMQAFLSASNNGDEFIKEYLISMDKVPILVHDLMLVDIWKEKIFTKILKLQPDISDMFPIFVVLHHEATVVNLLETVLFHQEACEAANDTLLDLIDYCAGKLTKLLSSSNEDEGKQTSAGVMEQKERLEALDHGICMKIISIIRYMSDHYNNLQPSVLSRLLSVNDIPMLFTSLIENPPWFKTVKDQLHKFVNGKWQSISPAQRYVLNKTDGQVWITLFHLLLEPESQTKYYLDEYRKNRVIKLRAYLTEMIIEQMPCLGELARYLEHLSMNIALPPHKDLILQQVAEIRDTLIRHLEGKESELAKKHLDYFSSGEVKKSQAKLLMDTYNMEHLEQVLPDPPKCVACGQQASKRCSRCKIEWYCSKSCQVKNWPKHKKTCELLQPPEDQPD